MKAAVELRVPPGAAVLWRTATWHCVGPNLSARTRNWDDVPLRAWAEAQAGAAAATDPM